VCGSSLLSSSLSSLSLSLVRERREERGGEEREYTHTYLDVC
jgi:hypothetical protein